MCLKRPTVHEFDKTVESVDDSPCCSGVVVALLKTSNLAVNKIVATFGQLKPKNMKIKWGALVVDGRNKIGGHVASKNRAGAYLRTKVTPVNPQTSAQSAVRSALTYLSQSWRGLTAAQIAAWNATVANFTKTDIFGDIKQPSGINLYIRLNLQLHAGGAAYITDPPAPSITDALTAFSAAAAAGANTFTATFAPTPVPAGYKLIIEATPQVSPGKKFLKNQYRILQVIAAAGASPANIDAAYVARFGALVAGEKIGVRAKFLNTATGLTSLALSTEIIVAA